jgi:hypothetical protein
VTSKDGQLADGNSRLAAARKDVDRDDNGLLLREQLQRVAHGSDKGTRVDRICRLLRLEEERDLERPPPRRRE